MATRAYYEQENNFGVLDRIEIEDANFSGTAIELGGRAPSAFDFEHREVTGEQRDYLSLFENQIIMGVLDFYPRIDTESKKTLVEDIADSPNRDIQIIWKRDGDVVWRGYPYGRVVEYPEKEQYNVKIQFRDFEILKGKEYTLDDTRQKLRASLTTILNFTLNALLTSDEPIRTATSWQEENTTVTDDFINQVYADTYALRDYASDGFSTDQTISYYQALGRLLEPMLVLYQWKGFNIYQISALKNPISVQVATYGILGQLTKSNEDLRQTIYTSVDSGTPTAKVVTNNSSYPALRKASYEFKHRSGSSEFEFDIDPTVTFRDQVDFNGSNSYRTSLDFAGNGDEVINFSGFYETTSDTNKAKFAVRSDNLALDTDYTWQRPVDHSGVSNATSSINTSNGELSLFADNYSVGDPVMLQSVGGSLPSNISESQTYFIVDKDDTADLIKISEQDGGSVLIPNDTGSGTIWVTVITLTQNTEPYLAGYRARLSFESDELPTITDSDIEIILLKNNVLLEVWYNMNVFIENPTQAGESIEYRLTQDNLYPETFRLNDSYFGDGPFLYSKSSYRYSINVSDITTGWRRRGDTTYIDYSRLRLNEILDYQRTRQLKKNFKLWGEFDPIKVSVYEGDNFMYVGGKYNGRWSPITVKIEENKDV